jgi:hypothetical protein
MPDAMVTHDMNQGRWIRQGGRIILLGTSPESRAAQVTPRPGTPLRPPLPMREGEVPPSRRRQRQRPPRTLSVTQVRELIAANNHSRVSPDLLLCLIWKESSFDPHLKSTKSSATGLMQITRAAVEDVNRNSPRGVHFRHSEMTDPAKNIACGTRYLQLRINRASTLKEGLEGYGTGAGYADNLLSCDDCIKYVQQAMGRLGYGYGPPDPRICLQTTIHR